MCAAINSWANWHLKRKSHVNWKKMRKNIHMSITEFDKLITAWIADKKYLFNHKFNFFWWRHSIKRNMKERKNVKHLIIHFTVYNDKWRLLYMIFIWVFLSSFSSTNFLFSAFFLLSLLPFHLFVLSPDFCLLFFLPSSELFMSIMSTFYCDNATIFLANKRAILLWFADLFKVSVK